MRSRIAVLAIVLACGCGNGSDQNCIPGVTQQCFCPGGATGAQICLDDGSGYGDCDCGGEDTGTDPDVVEDVAPDGPCTTDSDCDNGLICDGDEICVEGACEPGEAIVCDDDDDCTTDFCDEDGGDCEFTDRDEDGDGYIDETCGGTDCDDSRDFVYPGATVICDDFDRNCDGYVDNDYDGDGQLSVECSGTDCDDTDDSIYLGADAGCDHLDHDCDGDFDDDQDDDGYVRDDCPGGDDCDDDDASINPGVTTELCDLVDDDCNGIIAEGYADKDSDDYIDDACGGDDCNDMDASISPGMPEACNGEDNDCDGVIDRDHDSDGYFADWCSGGDDCDDEDPLIYPGAARRCNSLDNDCDGVVDVDNDGDGHSSTACGGDDCNDDDDTIYAGAPELCDMIDQDCDGTWEDNGADDDLDGHLDEDCGGDDCDDDRDDVFVGALEDCTDGIDQDCDGLIDEPGKLTSDLNISDAVVEDSRPAVSWTGSEWGLAWMDDRDGDREIYFARMDTDGARVGTDIRVTDTSADSSYPALAWTGSSYGLVWSDESVGGMGLLFQQLAGDGMAMGSQLVIESLYSRRSVMVWSGSEFGLAWDDASMGYNVYFARVGSDGTKLTSSVRLSNGSANSVEPGITWTGSEYGICWHDNRSGTYDIYMARVSAVGSAVGSDFAVRTSATVSQKPFIASSGSTFGLVWNEGDPVMFASVSHDGSILLSDVILAPAAVSARHPFIMWTDVEFTAVWDDMSTGAASQVFALPVSESGVAGFDFQVSASSPSQVTPRFAWSGSRVGVAWFKDGVFDNIFFALLEPCR